QPQAGRRGQSAPPAPMSAPQAAQEGRPGAWRYMDRTRYESENRRLLLPPLHDERRQVVAQAGVTGVTLGRSQECPADRLRLLSGSGRQHLLDAGFLERLPARVFGFSDAVAEEHQQIAGL